MPMRKPATGFGKRLRELRDAKGMTQQTLAVQAELALQAVARIEQGKSDPHWPTVIALAEALGCTPNDFLAVEEPQPAAARRKGAGKGGAS